MPSEAPSRWYRVLELDELPEGRVKTVTAGHLSLAISHLDGKYGALDNRCPHQGGPLGEGTIEKGKLRCPWHGYDFCPLDGSSEFGDGVPNFPVEVREDGIYVGVPPEPEHKRTVTDVMAETMVAWGVRHAFGMVGHSNLGLADALRRQEEAGNLKYIGIRHEGAAAFAASAYGKLTGKPAACLTIAGPGATNLLTGLWDAHVDRAPVLALTGQVPSNIRGAGAFQDLDLGEAYGGVATYSQTVLGNSRHAELMSQACKHAILEEGVAHLIFPDEMQTLPAGDAPAGSPNGRVPSRKITPDPDDIAAASELIAQAKRPVLIIGNGARDAIDEVIGFAESINAPVITTFRGKGLIGDDHPLACGVLGRSGTPVASWFMNESDLLIVLGASFSNHTGIYAGKPIIQVDRDSLQLGKHHPVQLPLYGDIDLAIKGFQAQPPATQTADRVDQRPEVAERWQIWREEKQSRAADNRGNGVASAAIFKSLSALAPADSVLCVDVGNHAYSFGRYFESKFGQAVLMSGYLGSIGFGYPAAMGAWAATDGKRPIIAITGDGGFGQYLAELTTAVKHNMNITHVLLNNGQLGKISKEQRAGEWDVWQTQLHNPNFAEYAQLCGAKGIRVENSADLDTAISHALSHSGPVLVEVMCDAELI